MIPTYAPLLLQALSGYNGTRRAAMHAERRIQLNFLSPHSLRLSDLDDENMRLIDGSEFTSLGCIDARSKLGWGSAG